MEVIINPEEMIKVYKNNKLSLQSYSFIGKYTSYVRRDNSIYLPKVKGMVTNIILAKRLGISKNVITKVIKELEATKILKKYQNIFYFNPNLIRHYKFKDYEFLTEVFEEETEEEKCNVTEKYIEDLLSDDIELIEQGMKYIDRQFIIEDSRIDILARDRNNILCIIELKATSKDFKLIQQCIHYPSLFNEQTRMIAIAPKYNKKIYNALSTLGYVEIKKYKLDETDSKILNVTNYDGKEPPNEN